jgi:hypothetical protein
MRVFTWLWLSFFVLCLFLDGIVLWSVRAQLTQAMELALDSGLIAGLSSEALSFGSNYIDEDKAGQVAGQVLIQNIAGQIKDEVELDLQLDQAGYCASIQAVASVRVPLLMTRYLGLEGYELKVRKLMNYQSVYK